jgi:wyosine [tRNA(Phe)-imidazoG37] synthetase (radical SAM superfamily)
MNYKHLFGPVPSRRLGLSLGVDLVPPKVCTLNCIYCEVGKTSDLTLERDEYVDYNEIIKELQDYLQDNPGLDYITFSGAGEPTLNSRIADIIKFIKRNYPQYKLALITNGTLFYDEQVRKDVLNVDLMLPSLDSAIDRTFKLINRPNQKLNIDKVLNGLIKLREEFEKEIWLEVFIVPSYNDTEEEIKALKKAIGEINPDRVQLNTMDRPGTEDWVEQEDLEKLNYIKEYLSEFNAEIIAKFSSGVKSKQESKDIQERIISILERRPCTQKDLSEMLNIEKDEIDKNLKSLLHDKKLTTTDRERGIFYKLNKD